MIIPGEGFVRDAHPFDVPIMPEPEGFWSKIGHQDRDFWAFQGPFEKFLYLDADIIYTGSLNSLFARIREQKGKFIFVHIYHEQNSWQAEIEDKTHPKHEQHKAWVKRGLGNPNLLTQFDPTFNPYKRCPFNSGIFASSRGAITELDLRELHEKEVSFYKDTLKKKFMWKSSELFYCDQGRLNYLVDKLELPIIDLKPDGHDYWAGDIRDRITVNKFLKNELNFKFIHWAGVPRPNPSIFCNPPFYWLNFLIDRRFNDYKKYQGFPEIPGYALWYYFQTNNEYSMRLSDRLSWSYADLKRIAQSVRAKFKKTIGKISILRKLKQIYHS
jgi:hypothetical protein